MSMLFADEDESLFGNQKHRFDIRCANNDEYRLLGRPCELSAFSHVPLNRDHETAERSIYNIKLSKGRVKPTSYDRSFHIDYDYNNHVHRDDRRHARLHGIVVGHEELAKPVPTRTSSVYGRRTVRRIDSGVEAVRASLPLPPVVPAYVYLNELDPPNRRYTRIAKVQSEFFNRNGINDLTRDKRNII